MGQTTKIYLVENCYGDSNKIYIGKTKCSRKNNHELTYGQQITYTYIDEIESTKYEDWGPLEKYWIEQFRQWGFKVMNKNKGGGGPSFWSDNLKLKMSLSKKGKPKPIGFGNKIGQIKKGRLRPDIKGRVSINKGKTSPNKGNNKPKPIGFGEKRFKPIIQYDLNNNFIRNWSSLKEAKLHTNIKNIPLALSGANKTAGGYIWKFKTHE